ncbi:MAG: hypothetical protein EOO16_13900 [Chitinophagaceae bacterium]|nr:MAG: hypothetical protein EOO16_13900 [Chitinophagaceae bacterium]
MKKSFFSALAFFVLMLLVMRVQGAPLSARVPGGILALEFAWSDLLFGLRLEWMGRGRVLANIWLDFLFIIAYTWFFVASCGLLRARYNGRAPVVVARVAFLAALLDIAENILMLGRIYGFFGAFAPPIAFICAALKFIAVAIVVIFLLNAWLFRRRVLKPVS